MQIRGADELKTYRAIVRKDGTTSLETKVEASSYLNAKQLLEIQYPNCAISIIEEQSPQSTDNSKPQQKTGCLGLAASIAVLLGLSLYGVKKDPKAPTDNGEMQNSNAISESSFKSDDGVSYTVSRNSHGIKLLRDDEVIYLGESCDAVSKKHGDGRWGWEPNGMVIYYGNKIEDFSGVTNPLGNGNCRI